MMREEPVLKVSGLTKTYRNGRGLHEVNLEIHRGEIYGLFGPNGAGKTTLLKLITGLIPATGGEIRWFGHSLTASYEKAMERVGCVIEAGSTYGYMTARSQLEQVRRHYPGIPAARTEEVLELTGLGPYAREKTKGFSLGMKQRLALAAALLPAPACIVMDEPTNGLDLDGILDIRGLIGRLAADEGVTFLIASHHIGEMEQVCSRAGVIRGGTLVLEGRVPDLLQAYGTLEAMYVIAAGRQREGA
ncbi:ATP-binding cassette domain-containing protein [Paenibacillus sp. KR2-11]|uniref:ATP-binding cassette domain-containing protein n=1 Tax=Paenibacillus sp. KR2-11 TaxID=3385500 RepID=UPI0038FCC752